MTLVEYWKEDLEKALLENGESYSDIVYSTINYNKITEQDLINLLDKDRRGTKFTLWTTNRVYFPAYYDGAYWVTSVPRNPCNELTNPVGGG